MNNSQQPTPPRDGSVAIGGHPWMARMIDKARLEAAGTIDIFDLEYPCPMDQRLLAELGLSGKEFQDIVLRTLQDEDILAAVKQVAQRH